MRMLNTSSHMAVGVNFIVIPFTEVRCDYSSQTSKTEPYAVNPYLKFNAINDTWNCLFSLVEENRLRMIIKYTLNTTNMQMKNDSES